MAASGMVFTIIENINFSVAGTGVSGSVLSSFGTDNVVTRCVVTNPSTNTAASGITAGNSRDIFENNDVFMSGASGGATGAAISTSANTRIIGNYIQMSSSSSAGPAISASGSSATGTIEDNTVIGTGGPQGIYIGSATASPAVRHNTVVGFVDGIAVITGSTVLNYISENMVTENTSNAINMTDAGAAAFMSYNRRRDAATINNGTNWAAITSLGDITTDTGDYTTDYINYTSQDLRLKTTATASPALGAAFPASASMGARQSPATAGAQVAYGRSQ